VLSGIASLSTNPRRGINGWGGTFRPDEIRTDTRHDIAATAGPGRGHRPRERLHPPAMRLPRGGASQRIPKRLGARAPIDRRPPPSTLGTDHRDARDQAQRAPQPIVAARTRASPSTSPRTSRGNRRPMPRDVPRPRRLSVPCRRVVSVPLPRKGAGDGQPQAGSRKRRSKQPATGGLGSERLGGVAGS